ncbi:MAG TPA: competence/damage-inducible protein A [Acidimicrobiia bacterium]|nr:competence/damage-inducible protein A [Acidimicrobiia bacterium]
MIVEVLAVGTELLLGQILNGNGAEIGEALADAGLSHYRQSVVGDNLARLTDAVTEATRRADALVLTGGLGPTQDDLTREALAAAAGVQMAFSDDYAAHLRDLWERRGREMPETNLRQAEHPEGSELIANAKGTAPGVRMRIGSCWVFALPGVPEEMRPMLNQHVIPFLVDRAGDERGVLVSRLLRTWGESESRIAEQLGDLYAASANPTLAFLASGGEIKLRLTARAATREEARGMVQPLEDEIRRRLGRLVFGADDDTVERIVLTGCADRGWSLGTAESATGGLVAAAITGVPGSSKVFRGSIVAYDREAKESVLGVPAGVIDEHGLVSEETAIAMARGASERLEADVVVAVTGSAGPESLEQPAGTMVFAVRTPEDVRARRFTLPGDRERVRTYSTTTALHLIRLAVAGEWWSAR